MFNVNFVHYTVPCNRIAHFFFRFQRPISQYFFMLTGGHFCYLFIKPFTVASKQLNTLKWPVVFVLIAQAGSRNLRRRRRRCIWKILPKICQMPLIQIVIFRKNKQECYGRIFSTIQSPISNTQ